MSVDINLSSKRVPIVYTTRLEDMPILRKELSTMNFEDTIKIIMDQSKPCPKNVRDYSNISNSKHMCCVALKLKRKRNNNCTNIRKDVLLYKSYYRRYSKTYSKLPKNVPELRMNCAKEANEAKLKSLLAMCKPLRVVLEDIGKKISKKVHTEDKVIYVSSSDDEGRKNESNNVNAFYTIRNTDEFKEFLIKKDLSNSIVVFYNINEIDAYEIDKKCIIVDSFTAKSNQICRFRTQKRDIVYNIIVCCWKKRQYYISLLQLVEKYRYIANIMRKRHSCKKTCKCCCSNENINTFNNFTRLVLHETDGSNNIVQCESNTVDNATHSSFNNSISSSNKTSALIANASTFKKQSKWKGSQQKQIARRGINLSYHTECNSLLRIFNIDGTREFYEIGKADQIYSKLITKTLKKSSWLLKTQGTPRTVFSLTVSNPKEREAQIAVIKNGTKTSLLNFLRIPRPSYKINSNKGNLINKVILDTYACKIEYIRCLMGAKNKRRPVISISLKDVSTKISADNQQIDQHLTTASINDTNKDVSQSVSSLMKQILYRFRDINLTINAQGRVSASLNAPLNSLSPSELKILSDILKRAQSQVDELGLTINTLNEKTTKSLQSLHSNSIPNNDKYILTMNKLNEDTTNSLQINDSKSIANNDKCILTTNKLHEETELLQSNCSKNIPYNDKKIIKKYILIPCPPTNILPKQESNRNRKRKCTSDNATSSSAKVICHSEVPKIPDGPYISHGKSKFISIFSTWVGTKKTWYEKSFQSFLSHAVESNPPLATPNITPDCTTPKIVNVFSLQTDANPCSAMFEEISENPEVRNERDIQDIKAEIVTEFRDTKNNLLNEIQMFSLDDEDSLDSKDNIKLT